MFDNIRPTRAEIYLDNIVHNLSEVKRWVGKKVKIMGVVKANAYGHGACQVAKVLIENGVSYLGVATIEEALELRECGINIPILVIGYTPLPQAKELIVHNITQTVFDINYVKDLERIALNVGKKAKVHVKVDTGMGRIGYTDLNVAEKEIEKMMEMEGVEVEGIFSHFATSDEKDKTYAEQQFDMFKKLLESLKQKEINIPLKHIANSGAIIDLKYTYLDMVRPGIVLYGSYPSENVERPLDLR
ncbi:MAG TPA: alanine racemase, partial [Thermoanaerobacter sp.]|nr:alanine racemase [Thermoanaerobacter sp.]